MKGAAPSGAETVETPDLNAPLETDIREARGIEAGREVRVPGYSITRVRW